MRASIHHFVAFILLFRYLFSADYICLPVLIQVTADCRLTKWADVIETMQSGKIQFHPLTPATACNFIQVYLFLYVFHTQDDANATNQYIQYLSLELNWKSAPRQYKLNFHRKWIGVYADWHTKKHKALFVLVFASYAVQCAWTRRYLSSHSHLIRAQNDFHLLCVQFFVRFILY